MSRSEGLSIRVRELFLNGKWIANTNYKEQVMATGWQDAARSYRGLNSVALLVFHINYYLEGLLQVFNGGDLTISDKYSFDMPAIESPGQWEKMRIKFFENAERFAGSIEGFEDEKFDQVFVDEKYGSYLRNIEALIEHSYYHLGQVVLIRKLL